MPPTRRDFSESVLRGVKTNGASNSTITLRFKPNGWGNLKGNRTFCRLERGRVMSYSRRKSSGSALSIPAYQAVSDSDHSTVDIPDLEILRSLGGFVLGCPAVQVV